MSAMMLDHDSAKPFSLASVLTIDERHITMSYKEAVSCPKASFWKEAIKDEHHSLMENKSWTIVQLSVERKSIKSKWVLD
jgi:hypothetical protein